MINCLIIDDEKPAIDVLTKFVNDTPYLSTKMSTTDVTEAIDFISKDKADLLFIDIEMPKLLGLQFVDLYAKDMKVIITTAYSEYAIEGYERNIVDYLLKPIAFSRFLKATEKVLNQINYEKLHSSSSSNSDFLMVKTEHKGKFRKVNFDEIIYIEGLKNYVNIFTSKRENITTYVSLSDLEDRLPANLFCRVHRSYIVSLNHIVSIDGNEIFLKESPRVPTAGVFKDNLLRKLTNNILQK